MMIKYGTCNDLYNLIKRSTKSKKIDYFDAMIYTGLRHKHCAAEKSYNFFYDWSIWHDPIMSIVLLLSLSHSDISCYLQYLKDLLRMNDTDLSFVLQSRSWDLFTIVREKDS